MMDGEKENHDGGVPTRETLVAHIKISCIASKVSAHLYYDTLGHQILCFLISESSLYELAPNGFIVSTHPGYLHTLRFRCTEM